MSREREIDAIIESCRTRIPSDATLEIPKEAIEIAQKLLEGKGSPAIRGIIDAMTDATRDAFDKGAGMVYDMLHKMAESGPSTPEGSAVRAFADKFCRAGEQALVETRAEWAAGEPEKK